MEQTLRFRLRERDGRARIRYGRNDDPMRWGYGLLGFTSEQIEVARGYPVIEAKVEYSAEGYAAILSWIQVVRYWVADQEQPTVIVDVAPQMRDSGVPYFSWGIQPTLFDAPAFGREPDVVWRAWSFLTYTPDALMTPVIEPACGFRWGYDIRGGFIAPTDVLSAGLAEWLDIRNDLRERYPQWRFNGDDWTPFRQALPLPR
jgi:hypothetical protein